MMDIIERLRELLAKATPGPWQACGRGEGGCSCGLIFSITADIPVAETQLHDDEFCGCRPEIEGRKANAQLIAEAITALPTLLADYERLRGMEDRVKGLHAQLQADYNRPEGRWGMHGHSAVDDDYFSALEYVIDKLGVALVPVPGGE
jgi:hypothetical protein